MDYRDPIIPVRPSPIAGTWYPGNPIKLASLIDSFVDNADFFPMVGEVIGIVAPHAGYRYSGKTAGYAFRAIKGMKPDLVVVISPYHNFHPEPVLTSAHQAYGTPLGEIAVDHDILRDLDVYLEKAAGIRLTRITNDPEHSLEIELPFLQKVLGGTFRLVPLMLRPLQKHFVREIGLGLSSILNGRKALLVASTDLSHFYKEKTAHLLDETMLNEIGKFSPEGVLDTEEKGAGFACGAYAVSAVLWAAKEMGANSVQVLHHSTSGDQTGDMTSVVGYGAAVILRREESLPI